MQQGPSEVWNILQKNRPLVVGEGQSPGEKCSQIYNSKSHITKENHFSGYAFLGLIGTMGFGVMCTTQ